MSERDNRFRDEMANCVAAASKLPLPPGEREKIVDALNEAMVAFEEGVADEKRNALLEFLNKS